MIKKIFLLWALLLLSRNLNATVGVQEEVSLQVCSSGDPYNYSKPKGREAIRMPKFYIEGKCLRFEVCDAPFMLYIYKGENLAYTTLVSDGMSQAYLPASLEGECWLMVVYDDIAYSGNIRLVAD